MFLDFIYIYTYIYIYVNMYSGLPVNLSTKNERLISCKARSAVFHAQNH